MSRLIDADKLKQHYAWWEIGDGEITYAEAKKRFDTIIDVQPTVGVMFDNAPIAKQKHGHWRKSYISAWHSSDDNDHLYLYCSVCGTGLELQGVPARKLEKDCSPLKYCPFCGAKMDKDKGTIDIGNGFSITANGAKMDEVEDAKEE